MSEEIVRIGGCDPEFLGAPEDEAIAGSIYEDLPKFEAGNQVNRKEAVKVIADAIRDIILEMAEVIGAASKVRKGEKLTEEEVEAIEEMVTIVTELEKREEVNGK